MHPASANEHVDALDGRYWLRDYVPGTPPPEGALDVWTRPD